MRLSTDARKLLLLLVVADPPLITKSPADFVASEGDTAVFECAATGNPRPTIRWRRLGDSSLPTSRTTISYTNALTITNLQQDDSGSYVCEASTVFGMTQAYTTLAVNGNSNNCNLNIIILTKLDFVGCTLRIASSARVFHQHIS